VAKDIQIQCTSKLKAGENSPETSNKALEGDIIFRKLLFWHRKLPIDTSKWRFYPQRQLTTVSLSANS